MLPRSVDDHRVAQRPRLPRENENDDQIGRCREQSPAARECGDPGGRVCCRVRVRGARHGVGCAPAVASAKVKPTVVLVPGAFTDASSWTGVIARLERAGYPVLAPADPLRSLSGDSTYIASVLASVKGPIVLVGHSYAGMVITNAAAGDPNVKALVYISAYIPAVGDSAVKLTGQFPGSKLTSALKQVPYADGTSRGTDLYINPTSYRQVFLGPTVTAGLASILAAEQRPLTYAAATQPSAKAAWKTIRPGI